MAIYHCPVGVISRGKGHTATAAASYRSRSEIMDERTGLTHDYTPAAKDLVFAGLYAPKDAPAWAHDRAALWNHVEAFENRKNSQLAREFEVSLPHELSEVQNRYLVQDFIKENFTRKGLIADVAIHRAHEHGDDRNIHAHIMVTLRKLDGAEFEAEKPRDMNSKEQLLAWRANWAAHLSHHLERHGFKQEADRMAVGHLTLPQQRAAAIERGDLDYAETLNREPTKHLGKAAAAMEREGVTTDIGNYNRAAQGLAAFDLSAAREERARTHTPQGANMAAIDPAFSMPTLEAFAKNLERGETGERFDAYLKQSGLSLARDPASVLHVTDGRTSVALERIISAADQREFLPHLAQPVAVALIPELKASPAAVPAAAKDAPATTPEQERLAARERTAQEIGKAWKSSHGDGLQFGITLGEQGLTLATGERGKYVAVDMQGGAHYMNARMLGGDTRSGEAAITDSLQKAGVSLPTVPEVRQELKNDRGAAWMAEQDAQRKAATAARDEERKAQAAEREQQRHAQRVEKLSHSPMVQTIRHAWNEAQTGQQFAAGLEVAGVLLVRVNENDAAESRQRQEAAKSHGYFAPAYKEGDYLALNKWGNAYALDMATLNAKAEDITKKLATLAPAQSLTLTQGKEVMSYWRAPAEFVSKTREAGQGAALGAGLILGGAVRIGEAAVKTLGGVLDYFFGGMSPQRDAPTAPSNNASRTPPPPLPRPTPQEQLRRLPPTISLPQTQEALRQLGGGADADILAEIRRQIEAAKNRDRDRSR